MRRSVVAVISMALILGACGGDDADPASTIEAYTAAYNAGDIDEVMTLFSEESVITGHPFATTMTGLAQIRAIQTQDMDAAASENAYTISNVEVSGDTVTWDHVWVNDSGEVFCKSGQEAVIEDGKFVSWSWAGGDFGCS